VPSVVASGHFDIGLPSWGRCFWQDPNDGVLFLAYVSGNTEVDFVTSADSGVTWSDPKFAFPVDDYSIHGNFDVAMDRNGEVHCAFRLNNFNCYAHLAKNGTTWDTEAPIWRPWGVCADSGSVGGHNGSIFINELNTSYNIATVPTPPTYNTNPEVYLVAKSEKAGGGLTAIQAAQVLSPYTSLPNSGIYSNDVSAVATGIPPGLGGGFPLFTFAGVPTSFGGDGRWRSPQVTYTVDNSGTCIAYNPTFGGGSWLLKRLVNTYQLGDPNSIAVQSGSVPFVAQGPTMGFEKGPFPFDPINSVLISTYEDKVSGFENHWDLLTTAHEHTTLNSDSVDYFVRVESVVEVQGNNLSRSTEYDSWADDVFDGGQPSNVAPALAPRSGTLCDITNGAASGVMYMYFNSRSQDGRHCVSRMLCDVLPQVQSTATNGIPTTYKFGNRFHPESGIRNFAYVDTTLAAGKDGIAQWTGMRALHHVNGQRLAGKSEFVATVGSGLNPSINRLIAWDFNKSIEGSAPLKLPSFSFDHIASSGNGTFVGLSSASIASSPGLVHNLFDEDTTTAAVISNGDTLTFEWNTPVIITRVEMPWVKEFGTGVSKEFFEIKLEISYDGVTFHTFKTFDEAGGRVALDAQDMLIKLFSEHNLDGDSYAFSNRMNNAVGRFLRITFEGAQTGTRDVREVRIYGAGTTSGETVTTFNDFTRTFVRSTSKTEYVEKFDGVFEFTSTPPGWRTYGDWEWGVQASGQLSRRNRLPTSLPTRHGHVQSGIFAHKTIGNGDGSALTTMQWMPLNTSGVVEVDITVGVGELDEDGNPGRTVSWDTRYHKIGRGVILPAGPEDDDFQFYVAPKGSPASGNLGKQSGFHLQGSCFVGTCDYFTVKTNVAPGDWTLRWMFRRGSSINAIPIAGDHSIAYIDNVKGLDAPAQPSIFGYLSSESFATGVIHGYMKKTNWEYINAYTKGYYWFEPRHGYIYGAPNGLGHIHGYLLGNKEGNIFGYALGGSGLLSIPSGAINGFVAVQSGNLSSINSYLLGPTSSNILGLLTGFDSVDSGSGIFGYMMTPDEWSIINGGLNLGASGVALGIDGFIASKQNEEIFGYVLGPPGDMSNIYGYLAPQNIGFINGYIHATDTGSGIIYSYLKTADAESDIHGFVLSSGDPIGPGQQMINGYLLNDGVFEIINGYIKAPAESIINGYMNAVDFASGSINVYMSGVGFVDSSIDGYLAGISGSNNSSIDGYLVGVQLPSSAIDGYLIGFGSSGICDNHGTVPFPALPLFVIPTGNFIN
jgi:hypothetical protein